MSQRIDYSIKSKSELKQLATELQVVINGLDKRINTFIDSHEPEVPVPRDYYKRYDALDDQMQSIEWYLKKAVA